MKSCSPGGKRREKKARGAETKMLPQAGRKVTVFVVRIPLQFQYKVKDQPIVVIAVKVLCFFGCCYGVVGTVLNVSPALSSFNSHTHLWRFGSSYHPVLY